MSPSFLHLKATVSLNGRASADVHVREKIENVQTETPSTFSPKCPAPFRHIFSDRKNHSSTSGPDPNHHQSDTRGCGLERSAPCRRIDHSNPGTSGQDWGHLSSPERRHCHFLSKCCSSSKDAGGGGERLAIDSKVKCVWNNLAVNVSLLMFPSITLQYHW